MSEASGGSPTPNMSKQGSSLQSKVRRRWVLFTVMGLVAVNVMVMAYLSGVGSAGPSSTCEPGGSGPGSGISGYSGGGRACPADLAIKVYDSADPVPARHRLFYLIEVTNNGPGEAYYVDVTNHLPHGVELDWIMSSNGYCELQGGIVDCFFYQLSPGGKGGATIVVRPPVPTTLTDTASVSAEFPSDPDTSNNFSRQRTVVGS
jgi:hypothetical protein